MSGSLQVPSSRKLTAGRLRLAIPILLGGFIVLVPSINPLPSLGLYDSKRILQIAVLVISGLWLLFALRAADGPLGTLRDIPLLSRGLLAAVLLIGCLSAALAAYPSYGFLEVFHLVLLAALALTIAHLYRTHEYVSDRTILFVLALSASLYVVTFAVSYTMSLLTDDIQIWPLSHIGFGHIRFFNQYQTWTLPLLIVPALFTSSRFRGMRYATAGLTALWWMLLFASGGRGTLLGVAAGAAAVLVLFGRRARPWLAWQAAAAVAGAMLYFLLFELLLTTDASLLDRNIGSDMGRFYYWRNAVGMIVENPLLGIGPMHHASMPGEYWAHPHSFLFQWTSEWGIPALLLVASIILWGALAWIRQSRVRTADAPQSNEAHVRIALTASLAAGLVHAQFSGVTIMPMSQMLMVLIVGWTLGRHLGPVDDEHAGAGPHALRKTAISQALVLVSIAVVLWVAVPDFIRREERLERYLEEVEPRWLHPRYWQQGQFPY